MHESAPSAEFTSPAEHASGCMTRGCGRITALWRRLTRHFDGDRYQPERHYMRGPGPKWHERNSPGPQSPINPE